MLEEKKPILRWCLILIGGAAAIITVLGVLAGKGSEKSGDAKADAFLQKSLEKQIDLSYQVLKQNQEVAATAKQMVEADAQSRKEFIILQEKIQDERGTLVKMFETLETEKRQIAMERKRDPIIAAALTETAFLLAVSISLAFCWVLLYRMTADSDEALVRDLLLQDLTSRQPKIFQPPPTPVLTHQQPKALTNKKT